jgi:hypothetical protein
MTLQELMDIKPRPVKISIKDASEIMGVTARFLQLALQQGRFPFGVGVEMEQWAYYVNTERFIKYMKGEGL